jgi:ATP-dependent DNA ligase
MLSVRRAIYLRGGNKKNDADLRHSDGCLVSKLPEGRDWFYEIKWHGYRALLIKDGKRVEIRSRNDKNLTTTYSTIAAAVASLDAEQAVIDGEIVAMDAEGRPSFQALQHRGSDQGHRIAFHAFDVLHLNGVGLTGKSLTERRKLLVQTLGKRITRESLELPGSADDVVKAARDAGLEGVIAKRRECVAIESSAPETDADAVDCWLPLRPSLVPRSLGLSLYRRSICAVNWFDPFLKR